MPRYLRLLAMLVAWCSLGAAHAQDQLPAEMKGTGLLSQDGQVVVPWSIGILSQEPDGTIKGRLGWFGRQCRFNDVPFIGSYRDGVLEISAPLTTPQCGAFTSTLKRSAGKAGVFEGTARIHGYFVSFAVTLEPR
jgi:hypothetical protein